MFPSARRKFIFLTLTSMVAVGLALIALPPTTAAVPGAAGNGVVNPSSGAYASTIEIAVPDYYDLEPDLALVYNSVGTNGFSGVGWALRGESFIERTSPKGGAPNYNADDLFALDGAKLLPCTTLGGTHCTRTQSYRRIQQDAANNQWHVWEKDGTKKTYTWLYCIGSCGGTPAFSQIFRWALKTAQDPDGNTITYNYWCDPGQNCYLDNIAYNGYTIRLWRETRPDVISFNNGDYVGHTRYRLKTIEVTARGSRLRAYKLTYAASAHTRRSILTGVQEYGRDVALDGNGQVTGGTSLPPHTMAYTGATGLSSMTSWTSAGNSESSITGWALGDYNGDGKIDIARYEPGQCGFEVFLSTGSGFAPRNCWTAHGNNDAKISGWALADYNGDGRTDIGRFTADCTFEVFLSSGTGFSSRSCWTVNGNFVGNMSGWKLGDYNGDGRADIARYAPGECGFDVFLSIGTRFSHQGCWTPHGASGGINGWALGDYNADGATDIARYIAGECGFSVLLSTGSRFSGAQCWTPHGTSEGINGWALGDFNADGATDIARYMKGECGFDVLLSTGRRMQGANCWTPAGTDIGKVSGWSLNDYNGDGKTDIARYVDGECGFEVWLSTGSDVVRHGCWTAHGNDKATVGGWAVGDYNGDGSLDIARYVPGQSGFDVMLGKSAFNDLLITMTTSHGGTTTLTYTPSSAWPSQFSPRGGNFPTVASVVVNDGRGLTGATTYSYADARFSTADKMSFGFRYQKAVVDSQGTYVETFSRHTPQSVGQVDSVYTKNSAGAIYGYTTNTYTESGDGTSTPYVSRMTRSGEFECNLTSQCRETRIELSYDSFDNVIQKLDHGDVALAGDERTTVLNYHLQSALYFVDLVKSEQMYSGLGAVEANKAADARYYYDGASDLNAVPTRGHRTRTEKWDSRTGTYLAFNQMQYDVYGNVTQLTDARGAALTTTYDDLYHQFPVRLCNALNQCSARTWDATSGLTTSSTDAGGAATTYTYDAVGRKITETDPAGSTTTWQFFNIGDPNQQRMRVTRPDGSPDGLWADTYTDGLGRIYKTVKEGAGPGVTYVEEKLYLDGSSKVHKTSLWYPSGGTPAWEVYEYDGAGRLTRTTHPDGTFASLTYTNDAEGKPYTLSVDELGHERASWADTNDQVTRVREKNGANFYVTTYTYDPLGNIVRTVDANNNVNTFSYSSLGHKLTMTDMDLGAWTYTYDPGGLLLSQTDAKGQTSSQTYDLLGRVLTKTVGGQTTRWFYDEAGFGSSVGRLTRVVYPEGSESYTYNPLGLVTASTQCIGATCKTIASAFDALGRLQTMTYPDGEVVTQAYAADGALASVSGYVTAMTWNPNGKLTQITYANGTTTDYTYDSNRLWLTSARVALGATSLYTAAYAYNAAALVTSMTHGTPDPLTTQYTYDDLDRLIGVSGAQSQTFTYDAVGNMLSNSQVGAYAYADPAHRHAVTTAGSASYAYDANGNLIAGDGKTFAWDTQNRLASVTQGAVVTSFAYGAGEGRLKKTQGPNTTLYFSSLVEVANGSPVQYYYAGPVLVARKEADGRKAWYHADRLGSTRLMTDGSGSMIKSYDYKPFGEKQSSSGTARNERGFTGQREDAETGLIYMVARYYDARLGRFLSADTEVGKPYDPQDWNRYSYVNNNPVNKVDPTGHESVFVGWRAVIHWHTVTVIEIIEWSYYYVIAYWVLEFYWRPVSVTEQIPVMCSCASPPVRTRTTTEWVQDVRRVLHFQIGVLHFRLTRQTTKKVPHIQLVPIWREVKKSVGRSADSVWKWVQPTEVGCSGERGEQRCQFGREYSAYAPGPSGQFLGFRQDFRAGTVGYGIGPEKKGKDSGWGVDASAEAFSYTLERDDMGMANPLSGVLNNIANDITGKDMGYNSHLKVTGPSANLSCGGGASYGVGCSVGASAGSAEIGLGHNKMGTFNVGVTYGAKFGFDASTKGKIGIHLGPVSFGYSVPFADNVSTLRKLP